MLMSMDVTFSLLENHMLDISIALKERQAGGKKIQYKHHIMQMCEEVEVQLHIFLTLALDGSKWSDSCSGHLTPCEKILYPVNGTYGV
jgi:hypothetical protein